MLCQLLSVLSLAKIGLESFSIGADNKMILKTRLPVLEKAQTSAAHDAQHRKILHYFDMCFASTLGVLQIIMVRRCQALLQLQVLATETVRQPASQHQTMAWQEVL